jgi:hypothetical protein
MSIRLAILAAAAVGGFFLTGTPEPAEAGSRIQLNLYPPFVHMRPRDYRRPQYYYYYDEDPYEEYAEDYYDEDFDTGPYYDEPPPLKRRVKPRTVYQDPYFDEEPVVKTKKKKKKPVEANAAPQKKPSKSTQTAAKPVQKPAKPTQTAAASQSSSAPLGASKVSCDKARQIVGDYGFSNIENKACAGSVYSFSAQRDGKTFAIKVSSLNGELTEVKRQ